MKLNDKLSTVLKELSYSGQESTPLSSKEIIPLIDLTLLDAQATAKDIQALAIKAQLHKVAAICIFPEHLDYISPEITIKRATVINFPTGNDDQHHVLSVIEQTATCKKIDEIDYVFPYQLYLSGNHKKALSQCHEALQHAKQHALTFKVILETGALPSMDVIYDLSQSILKLGPDFLKTSTGKISVGATIPAVFAMLSAIKDRRSPCGIKVSGGVKTVENALNYMQLASHMQDRKPVSSWFRLGASSLLEASLMHSGAQGK